MIIERRRLRKLRTLESIVDMPSHLGCPHRSASRLPIPSALVRSLDDSFQDLYAGYRAKWTDELLCRLASVTIHRLGQARRLSPFFIGKR